MKETPLTKTNKFPPQRQAISVIGSMIAKQKLIPTPRKSAWPKVRRMPSFPKAARSTMVRRTSQKERERRKKIRLIFISCKMHYTSIVVYYYRIRCGSAAIIWWKKRKLVLAGGGQSIFFVQSYSIIECVCVSTIYCTCHEPDHLSSTF